MVAAARTLTQQRDTGGQGERVIGLSFDDGYRDVAENALPVLEDLGFTATVFIVTGAVDGTVTFGWYERQPELLSWAEIEHLDASSALSFEAHSETHANLLTLSPDEARWELARSKATLESRLGRPVPGSAIQPASSEGASAGSPPSAASSSRSAASPGSMMRTPTPSR